MVNEISKEQTIVKMASGWWTRKIDFGYKYQKKKFRENFENQMVRDLNGNSQLVQVKEGCLIVHSQRGSIVWSVLNQLEGHILPFWDCKVMDKQAKMIIDCKNHTLHVTDENTPCYTELKSAEENTLYKAPYKKTDNL